MFYDLNQPVDGLGDLARREVVAMAMQLGYSGVAANHVVTGVMGETDRCRIRPLELPMILAAAPGVAESAKVHQKVLGVPQGQPFRQFSRITVVIDSPAQANVVNSANPVLKTYDLVAVRPMNQKMFNLACSQLEVDLISLDLSQRLPIRLKPAIVKGAVERGIFFEICYGRALSDSKARRELFINSLILQEGAGGRNIVMCSGARKAMELRGPYDVANMSTLFGLSLESAKNTVSRTCKSLLLHGVARKTYKGAIHVERVLLPSNPSGEAFDVPMEWDPLSLGGASADYISASEMPDSSVSGKKSTNAVEELKPAVSKAECGVNVTVQSVKIVPVTESASLGQDKSGLDILTRKRNTSVSSTRITGNRIPAISLTKTSGKQKRKGNALLGKGSEEAQVMNKVKRLKRKR